MEINDIKIPYDDFFTSVMTDNHNSEEMNILNIQVSCFVYWKVFEKIFVDYAQKIILSKLVYYYASKLDLLLEKKFSPTANENYISEDLSITKKRHDINTSIENLEQAKQELNKIL